MKGTIGPGIAVIAIVGIGFASRCPCAPRALLGRAMTVIATRDAGSRANIREAARRLAVLEVPANSEFRFLEALRLRGGVPDAPGIALVNGQRVTSEGGGICQVAGTVHAAALKAGLGVVERSGHSTEVHSLPPGLDAAVSEETGTDLVLWNGYPFPVRLGLRAEGQALEARWTADEPGISARVGRDGSGTLVRKLPDGREELLGVARPRVSLQVHQESRAVHGMVR